MLGPNLLTSSSGWSTRCRSSSVRSGNRFSSPDRFCSICVFCCAMGAEGKPEAARAHARAKESGVNGGIDQERIRKQNGDRRANEVARFPQ